MQYKPIKTKKRRIYLYIKNTKLNKKHIKKIINAFFVQFLETV